MTVLAYILIVAVLAIIPAWLAKQRGIGAVNYYALGVLLWPLAMIVVLMNKRPHCPHCRRPVDPQATVCGSCGRELSATPAATA